MHDFCYDIVRMITIGLSVEVCTPHTQGSEYRDVAIYGTRN